MKKGIIWLMLSSLIVAALVLASCGEAVPGQQEEEEEEPVGQQEEEEEEEPAGQQEEEEEPVAGVPQYGGEITLWCSGKQKSELPSPDIKDANYGSLAWLDFIQEGPVIGDTETYGPRGTDEYAFQIYYNIPSEYLKGHLVESWDVSHEEIVFHVRPGVYWAADHVDFMENRELTADDVAADMIRFWESPWGSRFEGMIKDIYVTDRYTVVVEFESFSHVLLYYIGYEDRALLGPPEPEIAGADKWKNQVGTGPWMYEKHEVGSYMSFIRNPNYWDTTTINGVEYQMPFIDRVVLPIIRDESTQIAALKTGVIELYRGVPLAHWETLDTSAPLMLRTTFSPGSGDMVGMRYDQPPFDDIMVRRALAIGTNQAEFVKLGKAEGLQLDFQPFLLGSPAYVPLEEMPAEIRLLYDYNPELAKQMLADAGYPDGFKTTLNMKEEDLDMSSLLVDQWAKIGVELEIKMHDDVSWVAAVYPLPIPQYTGVRFDKAEGADPLIYFAQHYSTAGRAGGGGSANRDVYSNPEFDELLDLINLELDVDEQTRLLREAALILLQDAPRIPLNLRSNRIYWWPWVKNYYGEATVADDKSFSPLARYMWIDEGLKTEMGY